jgi:alpha-ketoglutarate-dependent sulfate ester dioxygenase
MTTVVEFDTQQSSEVVIRPLQPTIGAEISGVDLRSPLSDAVRDQIKAAILDYKVVFFRDQELTREQHAAFAARFGRLYDDYPNDHRADPTVSPSIHQIAAENFKKHKGTVNTQSWDPYHSDTSWRLVPSWGAVLRAVNLPEAGGDTIWVDAGLAYDNLPDDVKERLEGLHAIHDYSAALQRIGLDYPLVAHPVVRVHRETGKKILWVDYSKNPSIVGLDRDENQELLTLIIDQYKKPEYQVRFNWRPGSLAFWDNRAAVHYGVRNYGDFPRLLERILILDEPLYADL